MKTASSPPRSVIAGLSLLWLVVVTAGLWQLLQYEAVPGAAASAPARWPANRAIADARRGATLVMVVHPRCPCSHASLTELAQLMAHSQGRLSATVLFVQYHGVSARWVQTDTWRQARAIPGVRVVSDPEATLAARFGAYTSGQTYLYDSGGRLLFSGGLTASRGHEGDNAGLSAALSLLHGQVPAETRTPVYGCPLFDSVPPGRKEPRCRS